MNDVRFALVALTAALVGEIVMCEKLSLADGRRTYIQQQSNAANSAVFGQWFLCYKGKVQACRRNKITERSVDASPVARQVRGVCSKHTCVNGNCTEGRCVCYTGWEGKRCSKDVNECIKSLVPLCDQRCYNAPGSYRCRCFSHYVLQNDGHTCLSTHKHRGNSTQSKSRLNKDETTETSQSKSKSSNRKRKQRLNQRRRQHPLRTETILSLSPTNSSSFSSLLDQAEDAGREALESISRFLAKLQLLKQRHTAVQRSAVPRHSALRVRSNQCHRSCPHRCVLIKNVPQCVCRRGYKLDKTRRRCVDYNECTSSKNPCSENSFCVNKIGGYTCPCIIGYVRPENETKNECEDINECLTGDHICSARGVCINMPGFYRCECMIGYQGDGINCTLNNGNYDLTEFVERSRKDDGNENSFEISEDEKIVILRKRASALAHSNRKRRNGISSRKSGLRLLTQIKESGKPPNA